MFGFPSIYQPIARAVPLEERIVVNPTTSVLFNTIPQTFRHLLIETLADMASGSTEDSANLYFNYDTTATNYYHKRLYTASSTNANSPLFAFYPAGGAPAGNWGWAQILIPFYALNFNQKIAQVFVNYGGAASGLGTQYGFHMVQWAGSRKLEPVSRIELVGNSNFNQESRFVLYGVP